jgi:hypothetical protein
MITPEQKYKTEQQVVYEKRMMQLTSQGYNTRAAKRKIKKEKGRDTK